MGLRSRRRRRLAGPTGTPRLSGRERPITRTEPIIAALETAQTRAEDAIAIVPIRTTGDRITDRPLMEVGGKGLFTKEIDDALLAGEVDIAVHSAKDLPTDLPAGIVIAATLADLPPRAVLGTSSLRRRAMALRLRPDLRVVEFRGNVETRLRKLDEGVADATILAMAGLKRLGLVDRAAGPIEAEGWLPAVAQGTIAITARVDDHESRDRLARIDDAATAVALRAERAFLAVLDGSCRTPIGGLALLDGEGRVTIRGAIVRPDGSEAHETSRTGAASDAVRLGAEAGEELHRRGGPGFFAG